MAKKSSGGNKASRAPGFGNGNGSLKKVGGLKKSKAALSTWIPKQFRSAG